MCGNTCVFCGEAIQRRNFIAECPVCGRYDYRSDIPEVYRRHAGEPHLVSGFIREQNEVFDTVPSFVDPRLCEVAIEQAPRRIPDKAAKLLKAIQRRTNYFGQSLDLVGRDYPLGYCTKCEEFNALLAYCRERGWLFFDGVPTLQTNSSLTVQLTAAGFAELEARSKANIESDKVFVAMRFAEKLKHVYDTAISPAIVACGYKPIRIDREEFNGDVIDRMLGEIRVARFLVADFTQHAQGVYFEAGFALGLSLPVIWTCQADEIGKAHFDTNHFSHIVWATSEDLRERLENRIRATIGARPPVRS